MALQQDRKRTADARRRDEDREVEVGIHVGEGVVGHGLGVQHANGEHGVEAKEESDNGVL